MVPIKGCFIHIKGWCITIVIIIIFILPFILFIFVILPKEILQGCVLVLLFLLSLRIYFVNCCIIIWDLSLLTLCNIYRGKSFSVYLIESILGNIMWKRNMKSFSNETLNFLFRKFWASYILDLVKIVKALRILSHKSTKNLGINELWALENHVLVNVLLWSSHFTEVH